MDITASIQGIGDQFRDLDSRDPSSWPTMPRYLLLLAVAAGVLTLLWFLWLSTSNEELQEERDQEVTLRADYKTKLQKAVSLEELKKQRTQVMQYVNLLEKQLPSRAEMDALLSDINQAGVGRSLQFELFRPGDVVVRDYYAELPISVRVTGSYHDLGAFTADIAHLSRIVTLNNLSVTPVGDKSSTLQLEATAKTFRYLDAEELSAQRGGAKKGAKK